MFLWILSPERQTCLIYFCCTWSLPSKPGRKYVPTWPAYVPECDVSISKLFLLVEGLEFLKTWIQPKQIGFIKSISWSRIKSQIWPLPNEGWVSLKFSIFKEQQELTNHFNINLSKMGDFFQSKGWMARILINFREHLLKKRMFSFGQLVHLFRPS